LVPPVETCAAAFAGSAGAAGALGDGAADCPWIPGLNSNKHTSPAISVFGNDILTPQQFKTKKSHGYDE
jgi:hypothetical protein